MADEAVAGIVDDDEFVGPGVLKKGSHLDTEFDAGVRDGGNLPELGLEAVFRLQTVPEAANVVVDGAIVLPAEEQDRDGGIARTLLLGLAVNQIGGIVQVTRKGLKLLALAVARRIGDYVRGMRLRWLADEGGRGRRGRARGEGGRTR